jgi:hypothetical protein
MLARGPKGEQENGPDFASVGWPAVDIVCKRLGHMSCETHMHAQCGGFGQIITAWESSVEDEVRRPFRHHPIKA